MHAAAKLATTFSKKLKPYISPADIFTKEAANREKADQAQERARALFVSPDAPRRRAAGGAGGGGGHDQELLDDDDATASLASASASARAGAGAGGEGGGAREDTISDELHMLLESVTDVHQLGFAVTDVPPAPHLPNGGPGGTVGVGAGVRADESDEESRLTISDDDSDDSDESDESDDDDDDGERPGDGEADEHAAFLVPGGEDEEEVGARTPWSQSPAAYATPGPGGKGPGLGEEARPPSARGGRRRPTLSVVNLNVDSPRTYEVLRADVGDCVYSDRTLRWTHLPPQLRKQLYIRTPCDDKMVRSKQLMRFSVNRPSLVLVLVDLRSAAAPPAWLEEDGFSAVSDQAIARGVRAGALSEAFYGIYGQYFDRGERVVLKGNWSREVHSMYAVFVVPGPTPEQLTLTTAHAAHGAHAAAHAVWKPVASVSSGATGAGAASGAGAEDAGRYGVVVARRGHADIKRLFEEVTFHKTYKPSAAGKCWVDGGNGLAMFYADNDVVSVGVRMGKVRLAPTWPLQPLQPLQSLH